jgi:hypothetical protein
MTLQPSPRGALKGRPAKADAALSDQSAVVLGDVWQAGWSCLSYCDRASRVPLQAGSRSPVRPRTGLLEAPPMFV